MMRNRRCLLRSGVGERVSFQLSILKVLASYPNGHASLEAVKADLGILVTSGRAWSNRMRRLAALVPGLNAFSEGYLKRDAGGWHLTDAGREFLCDLETRDAEANLARPTLSTPVVAYTQRDGIVGPVQLIGVRDRRNARRAGAARHQRAI